MNTNEDENKNRIESFYNEENPDWNPKYINNPSTEPFKFKSLFKDSSRESSINNFPPLPDINNTNIYNETFSLLNTGKNRKDIENLYYY